MSADPDLRDRIFDVTHLRKHLGARTGKAASTALFMSALRVLLQIASISILARLISPAEYGIYALAMPGVVLALALSNFGLSQAIVRDPDMTHRLASNLFWINAAFGILGTLALMALAGVAARFFDEPRVTPVFQLISLAVFFSAMTGPYMAIMRRRLEIRLLETTTLSIGVLTLGVAIVAALMGASYWALVIQQLTGPLLILIALMAKTGWQPSRPDLAQRDKVVSALKFGGFIAGYSIVSRMTGYVGTVVVGRMFDEVAAGLYYRAHNLAVMPRQRVVRPLATAFVPALSRVQHEEDAFRALYRRTNSRSALIMMPLAVLIALGAEPLVAVLLGPMWTDIVPILTWLALISAMAPILLGLNNVMMAKGLGGELFAVTVLRLILVTVAMVLAAPAGMKTMVSAYMLVELFLVLPITILAVIRMTPVTLRDILGAGGREFALAGLITAGLWPVAPFFQGLPALLELLALCCVIGAIYMVRILLEPSMRQDVAKVFLKRLRKG